jgi:PAS domain S-box-containing protein
MQTSLDMYALVNAVGDAVVACDAQGAITLWNPAAERMFGFSEAEALGASLDIIIPERMRKRHWDGYHETMRTGITKYGHDVLRVPAIGKDDRALSISFTVAMLFSADGKAETIVSVMRDETARFQEDRALRKRIAELEAGQGVKTPSASHATQSPPAGGCPFSGTAS